jgi:hypothetical protein
MALICSFDLLYIPVYRNLTFLNQSLYARKSLFRLSDLSDALKIAVSDLPISFTIEGLRAILIVCCRTVDGQLRRLSSMFWPLIVRQSCKTHLALSVYLITEGLAVQNKYCSLVLMCPIQDGLFRTFLFITALLRSLF